MESTVSRDDTKFWNKANDFALVKWGCSAQQGSLTPDTSAFLTAGLALWSRLDWRRNESPLESVYKQLIGYLQPKNIQQQQALQSFLSLEILSSSNMHDSSNQSLVIETEQMKRHLINEAETVLGTHLQGDCWSLWGAAVKTGISQSLFCLVFIAVTLAVIRLWWQWQQLLILTHTHPYTSHRRLLFLNYVNRYAPTLMYPLSVF